jgi:DNA-binding winged helix-turn-helix (wHTH) protein
VTFRFGPFALNVSTRQLTREGGEVHLSPKAFDLLAMLVAERPNVQTKTVLQQRLWPDTFVAEANLSNLIAEVRQALEDSARSPRYLRTVHGIGYAFCGEATGEASQSAARPTCWLEWGAQRFPLPPGEHVVGRDADASVRIDASTVSRRHARLVVTPDGATLEDFGSKNGTFHGSTRVTTPVRLMHGDVVGFGSLRLTFHVAGRTDTQTENLS